MWACRRPRRFLLLRHARSWQQSHAHWRVGVGVLPKFENRFPPVAAPKATPTLWALSAQPNKRGHQATPPQLLRGRRCAQRRNGIVGVAQTSCAAWTRPRKSFNKTTPPQVSRGRRYKLGSASGVAQTDCIQTLHASSSAQEHPRKEYFAYSDSAAKVLSTTPSFISPTRAGAMLRGLKHCGVSPPAEVGDRHATVSAPPVPLRAFTPWNSCAYELPVLKNEQKLSGILANFCFQKFYSFPLGSASRATTKMEAINLSSLRIVVVKSCVGCSVWEIRAVKVGQLRCVSAQWSANFELPWARHHASFGHTPSGERQTSFRWATAVTVSPLYAA